MSSRGFTLLELIVVLGVMTLIVSFGAPLLWNALPGVELKRAAQDIVSGLRETRSRAIADNREATFAIDVETRRFGPDGTGESLPQGLQVTLVTAASEQTDEDIGIIRFFPDGSSTGGRVVLAQGEREYQVDVHWLTGRISVRE